jgi:hypothetical protein
MDDHRFNSYYIPVGYTYPWDERSLNSALGIAMTIVAAVKYALESMSNPTVYMWCAQTMNPRTPIEIIA